MKVKIEKTRRNKTDNGITFYLLCIFMLENKKLWLKVKKKDKELQKTVDQQKREVKTSNESLTCQM
jgi:hypothetical protein